MKLFVPNRMNISNNEKQPYCWMNLHEQFHSHEHPHKEPSISHLPQYNSNQLHCCCSCLIYSLRKHQETTFLHSNKTNNNIESESYKNFLLKSEKYNSKKNTFQSDSSFSPCQTCSGETPKLNPKHKRSYPHNLTESFSPYGYYRKGRARKDRKACFGIKKFMKKHNFHFKINMEDSDSSNQNQNNQLKNNDLGSESSRLSDISLCSENCSDNHSLYNCEENRKNITKLQRNQNQQSEKENFVMNSKEFSNVFKEKHVQNWSVEDVGSWLESKGFGDYRSLFCDTHRIDGQVLITLTFDDLRNQLNISVFGDIRRLCNAFNDLKKFYSPKSIIKKPEKDSKETLKTYSNDSGNSKGSSDTILSTSNFSSDLYSSDETTDTDDHRKIHSRAKCKVRNRRQTSHHHPNHRTRGEFKPEFLKALLALFYAFMTTWVTAFVMVIVHDRVPDMDTYPPLPDIILDNLPLIPWAFGMCEFCGLVLLFTWVFILIFHKHRFILIRRMFSLFGSVFLLRCVTMLITSLSVPGKHLNCKARAYGSWSERLHQAYLIWQGGGMSLQGVRTCGDYMYSGHTVVLTMLNFFITEYTPPKFYLIHTVSWVLNCFGIFFILAAHEHYSIDVFVAFYISTRIFLYYHTLANNRALYQSDRRRTRIWFPLFSFFEANVPGIVPNEFENPFKILKNRMKKFLEEHPFTSKYFSNNSNNNSRISLTDDSSSKVELLSTNSNKKNQ